MLIILKPVSGFITPAVVDELLPLPSSSSSSPHDVRHKEGRASISADSNAQDKVLFFIICFS